MAHKPIMDELLGIYFDRFDGRRYIPNAEKRANYPDDDAVAEAFLNSN